VTSNPFNIIKYPTGKRKGRMAIKLPEWLADLLYVV
jgi:uncharacterized protein (DUF3820 family)